MKKGDPSLFRKISHQESTLTRARKQRSHGAPGHAKGTAEDAAAIADYLRRHPKPVGSA